MNQSDALYLIAQKIAICTRCQELSSYREENRYFTVPGEGNHSSRILFIGEGPGQTEAETGRPFVGKAGSLLTDIIQAMDWERKNVFITNVVKCRPPQNRDPSLEEANNCRPYLDLQISVIKPRWIICLGRVAAINLLRTPTSIPAIWESKSMGSFRGFLHEYKGIKVLCTYHPSYLLRNPAAKQQVWDDLQILAKEMKKHASL